MSHSPPELQSTRLRWFRVHASFVSVLSIISLAAACVPWAEPPPVVPVNPDAAGLGLPDDVFIRGNVETYNRRWYFALRQGRLWAKPNTSLSGFDGNWRRINTREQLDGNITEISVDDEDLIAYDENRTIHTMKGALGDLRSVEWRTVWGHPFWTGPGLEALPARSWSHSFISPFTDVAHTEPSGNTDIIGVGVTSIFSLGVDGRRITFYDPWLPADHSYEVCGPLRGQLEMTKISASGSGLFVVDPGGDLYTRTYDFDMSGGDHVFVGYSWGTPDVSPLVRTLPVPDWIRQPSPPGPFTNEISIHKIEALNPDRVLRVAGWNAAGDAGYWEKRMMDLDRASWTFVATGIAPQEAELPFDNVDRSENYLAAPEDSRWVSNDVDGPHGDVPLEIVDANPVCSPWTLRVGEGTDRVDLPLHTVQNLRLETRARDWDDTPAQYRSAIELPTGVQTSLGHNSQRVQDAVLALTNGERFTPVAVDATSESIHVGGTLSTSPIHFRPFLGVPPQRSGVEIQLDGVTQQASNTTGSQSVYYDEFGVVKVQTTRMPCATCTFTIDAHRVLGTQLFAGSMSYTDTATNTNMFGIVALATIEPDGVAGARGINALSGFVDGAYVSDVPIEWSVDDRPDG